MTDSNNSEIPRQTIDEGETWYAHLARVLKTRLILTGIGVLVTCLVIAIIPAPAPYTGPTPSPTASGQNSDALLNDLLQSIIKTRKEYEAKEATFSDQVDELYSASSFANRHQATRLIKAVTDLDELDRQYAEGLHQLPNKTLAAANKAGLGMPERVSLTFNLQMQLADLLKATDDFQAAEDEWVQNTVELYQFTAKHSASIVVAHNQATFSDVRLKKQFGAQLSKCRSSISKMQAADQKLKAVLQEESKKYGITQTSQGK